jgi:uncharacterized membrane protein YhaH (DUF805 family)
MKFVHLLFGFQGRISRANFWLSMLIWFVFIFVVLLLGVLITSSLSLLLGMMVIIYIPIVVSSIAVGIKRLHDREKTGWWLLLFYGAPSLSLLVSLIAESPDETDSTPVVVLVLQYLSFAVLLWALFELGFLRGTIGGNAFGPDPLAPKLAKH